MVYETKSWGLRNCGRGQEKPPTVGFGKCILHLVYQRSFMKNNAKKIKTKTKIYMTARGGLNKRWGVTRARRGKDPVARSTRPNRCSITYGPLKSPEVH